MSDILTVLDLLSAGGPLAGADLVGGASGLQRQVTSAVSLRPYSPAIPPMKGGEFALMRTDLLSTHEPRVTVADVVRQVAALGASGLAVHGAVDRQAIAAAEAVGTPLMRLPIDSSPHTVYDIEQDIVRECALFHARREAMAGSGSYSWVGRLLAGQMATPAEAYAAARRAGYATTTTCAVALIAPNGRTGAARSASNGRRRKMKGDDGETIQRTTDDNWDEIERISALLTAHSNNEEPGTIPYLLEDGLAVLVPRGLEGKLDSALRGHDVACGLGKERPLVEAAISLREARLALLSSAALHTGKMVHYSDLGAEQVVLLLYQDSRGELESFVQQTLGPLLEHDSGVSTPLLPTVSLFARHGWRIGEAASDEQLHKNTLVYRLDRAARILGLDLKQPESRLTVQLALWALPLVREYDCPS